ncbi:MAG: hypothetical protein M1831_002755 [Alyxoria varia]|nr:MAG: hypothetical protein M1831_002755 [Alyxoria varia]
MCNWGYLFFENDHEIHLITQLERTLGFLLRKPGNANCTQGKLNTNNAFHQIFWRLVQEGQNHKAILLFVCAFNVGANITQDIRQWVGANVVTCHGNCLDHKEHMFALFPEKVYAVSRALMWNGLGVRPTCGMGGSICDKGVKDLRDKELQFVVAHRKVRNPVKGAPNNEVIPTVHAPYCPQQRVRNVFRHFSRIGDRIACLQATYDVFDQWKRNQQTFSYRYLTQEEIDQLMPLDYSYFVIYQEKLQEIKQLMQRREFYAHAGAVVLAESELLIEKYGERVGQDFVRQLSPRYNRYMNNVAYALNILSADRHRGVNGNSNTTADPNAGGMGQENTGQEPQNQDNGDSALEGTGAEQQSNEMDAPPNAIDNHPEHQDGLRNLPMPNQANEAITGAEQQSNDMDALPDAIDNDPIFQDGLPNIPLFNQANARVVSTDQEPNNMDALPDANYHDEELLDGLLPVQQFNQANDGLTGTNHQISNDAGGDGNDLDYSQYLDLGHWDTAVV